MSYIFPKRLLQEEDILDPNEINDDFIPAAELYSGKLNAHNADWKQISGVGAITPTQNALFEYVYTFNKASPGFGTPGSYDAPSHTKATNEVAIPNTFAWTTMETTTITTGISNLWILGAAQYLWTWWASSSTGTWDGGASGNHPAHGFGGEDPGHSNSYDPWDATDAYYAEKGRPAGVQFALRVDGQVLEWTITGKHNPFEAVVVPNKPIDLIADGLASGAYDYTKRTTACGPEMFPVRMGSVFPVQAGTHTIEVVSRRIPRAAASFNHSKDHVYTFNRQLFVLDMPNYPSASVDISTVQPSAFDTEDTLSASTIGTDGIDAVREALNDIEPGAFGRGAFTHEHLASPVLFADQVTIDEGRKAYNHFPGYTSDDVASSYHNQEGWYLLDDATGSDVLSVGTGSSTTWSTAVGTVAVVLANVSVTRLMHELPKPKTLDIGNRYRDVVGIFTLGYYDTDASAWVMWQQSQVAVNHQMWWSQNRKAYAASAGEIGLLEGSDNEPDRFDIALMAVSQFASKVTKIGVFGSIMNMGGKSSQAANGLWYQYDRGSLQVFQLKV